MPGPLNPYLSRTYHSASSLINLLHYPANMQSVRPGTRRTESILILDTLLRKTLPSRLSMWLSRRSLPAARTFLDIRIIGLGAGTVVPVGGCLLGRRLVLLDINRRRFGRQDDDGRREVKRRVEPPRRADIDPDMPPSPVGESRLGRQQGQGKQQTRFYRTHSGCHSQ